VNTTGPPPQTFELRVQRIEDASVRESVAGRLAARLPPHDAEALARALCGSGLALHVQLADSDAAALLRDLYATGIPPVAVVLRPTALRHPMDSATERRLSMFTQRGGRFVVTWNWGAFLFGPLWYLRNGLHGKGLVLLALVALPLGSFATTVLISVAAFLYCGLAGNWDYYLWTVERKQWW
jgi:hypothetical protein